MLRSRRPRGRRARFAGAVLLALLLPGATAAAADAGPLVAAASAPARQSAPEDTPGYPWTWPAPGSRTVVDPFRAPAHAYGPGHRGMDVAASVGREVRAPADGVVAFRGVVVDRPLLTIDHGGGHVTTLEPVASDLTPGDRVDAGQIVGTVATGGHTVRGALHLGVRIDGDYVNPRPLFGAVPRAVLLPCCR